MFYRKKRRTTKKNIQHKKDNIPREREKKIPKTIIISEKKGRAAAVKAQKGAIHTTHIYGTNKETGRISRRTLTNSKITVCNTAIESKRYVERERRMTRAEI